MRKEAPLSEFKRKDGMMSLEHCQERIFFMLQHFTCDLINTREYSGEKWSEIVKTFHVIF